MKWRERKMAAEKYYRIRWNDSGDIEVCDSWDYEIYCHENQKNWGGQMISLVGRATKEEYAKYKKEH